MEPTAEEVIEWLEWGVPSDFVIRKEASSHLKSPQPMVKKHLALDLNVLVRYLYPRGAEELEGLTDIYKDMVKRLKA